MQTEKDHIQAYRFSIGRLERALAAGDVGTGGAPLRRANLGACVGIILAALLCAAGLVVGLISPAPSQAWRKPGALIVEQETGTRYLLLGGQLHPVVNYASALLAAGQAFNVQYVPRAQLAGLPLGPAVGIPGAPDDVPQGSALLPGTWALCLRPDGAVVVDLAPAGRTSPGPADRRVLVMSADPADPAEYVVWNAVKYPVPHQDVLPALGLGGQQPIAAAAAWLDTLPTGTAVAPSPIPGRGRPGPLVAGQRAQIGALFFTDVQGAQQYYVVLADGLAPVTATEADLFAVAGSAPPRQVTAAVVAAAPASADRTLLSRLPDFVSGPVFSGGESLCALQSSPGAAAGTRIVAEKSAVIAAAPAVVVPQGAGMLARSSAQGADGASPDFLIADTGERYLISGDDALGDLGYSQVAPNVLPAAVLLLIPQGPVLDAAAATGPAAWPSG